jgi:hypothetical protein
LRRSVSSFRRSSLLLSFSSSSSPNEKGSLSSSTVGWISARPQALATSKSDGREESQRRRHVVSIRKGYRVELGLLVKGCHFLLLSDSEASLLDILRSAASTSSTGPLCGGFGCGLNRSGLAVFLLLVRGGC